MPREATVWLRMEGAGVLIVSLLLYNRLGAGWLIFLVLLFVPDFSMLGYLAGKRVGATIYNAAHTYVAPLVLAVAGLLLDAATPVWLATIWTAHIGLDRLLGYGLKLTTGFRDTHLGPIGRTARP
ncbi:MAG TPA: DUF4260 domain-containing protein [Gemmatimonadales bacterium]|nr:DUF4260 domain-containing protein [Gemmatimonadales bacterium]